MAITLKATQALDTLLKEHGSGSSISSKKVVWKLKGLDRRLGRYTGTPSQIKALTNSLKNNPLIQNPNFNPKDPTSQRFIFDQPQVVNPQTGQMSTSLTKPIQPAPQVSPTQALNVAQAPTQKPTYASIGAGLEQAKQSALRIQESLSQLAQKGYGENEISQIPQNIDISQLPQRAQLPEVLTPTKATEQKTDFEQNYGISAKDIIPDLPTEQELISSVFASPEFKLQMDRLDLQNMTDTAKAEATKQALETRFAAEKTTLENNLASAGLAFSGIRATQVKSLADSLASSQLNVDRELASKLLDANLDLREAILSGVADIVKQAQKGREDAIEQLNKAGMAVVGDKLVPTIEAQRFQQDSIRDDIKLEMDARELELKELEYTRKLNEPLSVSEAAALGVPYGTTKMEAFGITPQKEKSLTTQLAELLSPTEASNLGVPFGTTKAEAAGLMSLSAAQRNTLAVVGASSANVDSIANQLELIIDEMAETPVERLTKGSKLYIEATTQSNEDAALFQKLKEGLLSNLARATGERGMLTDTDVGRARELLPKLTDTQGVARGKITQLRDLLNEFSKRTQEEFTTPVLSTGSSGGGTIVGKMFGAGEGGTDERITVVSPDGTTGTIPASQLQDALSQGYKQQ